MTIDELKAYGANTEEGLQRCLNNEGFYLRMVKMIPGDANFRKLYDAVDSGDLASAFDAAHALKGSTGNLALTPILAPIIDYSALIEAIRKGHDELQEICAE